MEQETHKGGILIAGLGNVLLRDDGIGVHAVRALQDAPPSGCVVAEIGTAILHGLHLLEAADHILAIDAVKAGGKPGTIYTFPVEDAEETTRPSSLHELNLVGAFRMIPDKQRPAITILGVEPATIDYGMALTEVVSAMLPQVLEIARGIVAEWASRIHST